MVRLPDPGFDAHLAGLRADRAHANRHGITGIIDPRIAHHEALIYGTQAGRGERGLWVAGAALVLPQDDPAEAVARLSGFRANHPGPEFHIQSAKFFMAGVFENRTAATRTADADQGTICEPMFTKAQTLALMTALDAVRFQLHAPVIGDAACTRALEGLAAARAARACRP